MVSPDFIEMSRREFDAASRRILTRINPRRVFIANPLTLEKKMIRIMSENKDYKLLGALKRGYAQRAFLRNAEGDRFHRIWLGWLKPRLPKVTGKKRIRRKRARLRKPFRR